MPTLADAKEGEVIYMAWDGNWINASFNTGCRKLPCTILTQFATLTRSTVIAWKQGETYPVSKYQPVVLTQEQKDKGFVYAVVLGSHCHIEMTSTNASTPQQREKPCKQCSKMNDIGVNKCWLCETLNPTPAS